MMESKSLPLQQMIGWTAVFCSAFCFYMATVIIRWSEPHVEIDTPFFVFARFLLGFLVVCVTLLITRQRVHPRRNHFLFGRFVANTVAVFCFYKAVSVGSVAEANILNMTYPLFVALFGWFALKEQRDPLALLIVGLAFAGIYLVLTPSGTGIRWDNLWGLSSGIMTAAAMIYLNISRRYHDSQTILFYMFGFGVISIGLIFHQSLFWPDSQALFYLAACSIAGVAGQYLLTYGFFYVTAVEGSIISSSRIVLAAILGPLMAGDPALTLIGWLGAVLIFGANSLIALKKITS